MNRVYAVVAARALNRCEYCLAPEAIANFPFEVEHVHPTSRGGTNTTENLALACRSCNIYKSDALTSVDPATGDDAPLFNPRTDRWNEHFQIDDETGHIDGLTPTGRATIELLRMNSPRQVAARLLWLRLDLYP